MVYYSFLIKLLYSRLIILQKDYAMEPWIIWAVARLLIPLTILRWPFWGTALSAAVDMLDYQFLHPASAAMTEYQVLDKVLDTYYLGVAALTSLSWKDSLAKKISIFSFLYRLVGVILFTVTQFRPFLLIFPNFFENFFFFYHIYRFFAKRERLFLTKTIFLIIVPAILLPKLFQEYFIHIVKIHPTELVRLSYAPHFPDPALLIIQSVLYLLLPFVALSWSIHKYKINNKYPPFLISALLVKLTGKSAV